MNVTAIQLLADGQAFLDAFPTETVIYRPADGDARNVIALVDREAPGPLPGAGAAVGQQLTITVINQATNADDDDYGGITSDEIDTGGDKVDVAPRVGETRKTRMVKRIAAQDEGMMTVELR